MSKTKKSSLSHYEILFIVPNKFTEDEAKQVITQVEALVAKHKGTISFQEYWGKKKLAYPIKRNVYGYYALMEFDMERANVLNLSQDLKLSSDVLRYQIISQQAKTALDLEREAKIKQKIAEKEGQKNKKIEKKSENDDEKDKDEKNEVSVISKTKKVESTNKDNELKKDNENLKELDEKLEGILSADDLL